MVKTVSVLTLAQGGGGVKPFPRREFPLTDSSILWYLRSATPGLGLWHPPRRWAGRNFTFSLLLAPTQFSKTSGKAADILYKISSRTSTGWSEAIPEDVSTRLQAGANFVKIRANDLDEGEGYDKEGEV